jgi:hypothetical protein
MGKEASAAGRAQGCRIFSPRLSTRYHARFHTSIKLHHEIPPAAGKSVQFAHLLRDVASTLDRMTPN